MIKGRIRELPDKFREKTREFFEIQSPSKIKFDCNIHNKFEFEVIDSKTGQIKQKAKAENVILNQMWETDFAINSWFHSIWIGRGEGTPSETDTNLFDFIDDISFSSDKNKIYVDFNNTSYVSRTVSLLPESYVGETITEIGIGWSSSRLCTHAMLTDMNGNPISILKTSTDIINITATVFVSFGSHPNIFNGIGISGDDADAGTYFIRGICGLSTLTRHTLFVIATNDKYNQLLNRDSVISFATNTLTSLNTISSNAGTKINDKTIKFTLPRWPTTMTSVNGTNQYICFCDQYVESSSWLITPIFISKVPESIITNESIGTGDGVNNKFKFKFKKQKNINIKIDGVTTTDYNILFRPPSLGSGNNIDPYFEVQSPYKIGTLSFPVNSGSDHISTGEIIYKNPYYDMGMEYIYTYYQSSSASESIEIQLSNDLINWIDFNITGNGSKQIPEEYRYYKYIKLISTQMLKWNIALSIVPYEKDLNDLIFNTAPPEGAVITADYTTECLAKDENHVYDYTVEFTFNSGGG